MVHELVVAAKFDYISDVYILEMQTITAYDALIIVLHLIVRYSPVTTSQTHALPRISTRGYTQKAAVCHA